MDIVIYNELKLTKLWAGGVLFTLLLITGCKSSPTMEITFGGDIMLAREGQALFNASPWSDFGFVSSDVNPAGEHLFFANLESPLAQSVTAAQTEGYNLCADAKQAELLRIGGLDLVVTANNHQGDCGKSDSTISILEKSGIQNVNAVINPVYLQTKVGVVGVVAANVVGEHLDLGTLLKVVSSARQKCDILVVSLHWGYEYAVEPSVTQREWAHKLSDSGVDVLWGHHPHVLQPVEWVSGAEGDHRMLAIYSLGNLLADQWMTWDTQHSALLTVRFTTSGIDSLSVHPIHMDPASRKLLAPSEESIERIKNRLWLEP